MSRAARRLESDRAARDAARELFDERLAQVRADLDARGVGGRIADRIGHDARGMFAEAVDIASDNRGVIVGAVAGTIVAITLWILRNPVIAWIEGLMSGVDE